MPFDTVQTLLYMPALAFSILLGLVIGSFLNVCIYRIPRAVPVWRGRSHCTSCGAVLGPAELVPVLSYLLLRGRCRHCRARISPRYMLVESLTGILYGLCFIQYGFTAHTLLLMAAAAVLVTVAFIDWDTKLIPDRFHVLLLLIGVIDLFGGNMHTLGDRLIGLFAISVPLLVLALATGGIGGGDIKLMAAAGFLLGWQAVLFAALVGYVTGAVYAVRAIVSKKKRGGDEIAFGPFLCLGIMAAALWGDTVISWYIGLLG